MHANAVFLNIQGIAARSNYFQPALNAAGSVIVLSVRVVSGSDASSDSACSWGRWAIIALPRAVQWRGAWVPIAVAVRRERLLSSRST